MTALKFSRKMYWTTRILGSITLLVFQGSNASLSKRMISTGLISSDPNLPQSFGVGDKNSQETISLETQTQSPFNTLLNDSLSSSQPSEINQPARVSSSHLTANKSSALVQSYNNSLEVVSKGDSLSNPSNINITSLSSSQSFWPHASSNGNTTVAVVYGHGSEEDITAPAPITSGQVDLNGMNKPTMPPGSPNTNPDIYMRSSAAISLGSQDVPSVNQSEAVPKGDQAFNSIHVLRGPRDDTLTISRGNSSTRRVIDLESARPNGVLGSSLSASESIRDSDSTRVAISLNNSQETVIAQNGSNSQNSKTISLQPSTIPVNTNNNLNSDLNRRSISPPQPTTQVNLSPIASSPLSAVNMPEFCEVEAINPSVWKQRHISEYLQSYPGGFNKNVTDLARDHGIFNWDCKVGEFCDAGQICGPIPGPVWHVFVSIQNWMNLKSATIKGVTFAANMLQTQAAGLAIDLHEPDSRKFKKLFKIEDILTLAVGISAVICAAVMWVAPGGQGIALGLTFTASAILASAQASVTIAAQNALKDMKSDAFTRWADYSVKIGEWEQNTQQLISNQTDQLLSSGISTENGIYGEFKEGYYFLDVMHNSTAQIERDISKVVTARLVSNILISKRAFVTVHSDECDNKGANGAFKIEDGWLSYCDKMHGTMMNIVQVDEHDSDKTNNHLYNAMSIKEKYNITTEYIVQQSVECQKKYGGWSHDPYQNGTLPFDINADCIMNLPVCYCQDWNDVRKHRKHHSTVKACRNKGHLPI